MSLTWVTKGAKTWMKEMKTKLSSLSTAHVGNVHGEGIWCGTFAEETSKKLGDLRTEQVNGIYETKELGEESVRRVEWVFYELL